MLSGALRQSALRDPVVATMARSPLSARRTSHLDMYPSGSTSREGLRLLGAARDLATAASGEAEVKGQATVTAEVGPGRVLRSLVVSPAAPRARLLLGLPVASGFRSEAVAALPEHADARTPLYLLVDDLPVGALIAGYADMYLEGPPAARSERPRPGKGGIAFQTDVCAGWASDATMLRTFADTGVLPVPVGPPAPPLETGDDPLGWHSMAPLGRGGMRRRRLVDVTTSDELVVRAMFRDTHVGHDGLERVLHEYELEAAVDPATATFTRCDAAPRVLPWLECPRAASSARELVGRPVASVRDFVRQDLRGLRTCTHLNDLLRSLGDVVPLTRMLGITLGAAPS